MSWHDPALIVGGGVLLRVLWMMTPAGAMDGDEAILGLMGLHILQGRDYPIYFWEAHYDGALGAYVAAVGYSLFGFGAGVLKNMMLPYAAGYMVATYALALRLFDSKTALVALLFAAVQPAIPFAYSIKPSAYPEILCLGSLALWLVFTLPASCASCRNLGGRLALLGFLWGFGFYIQPLIVPYMAVGAVFLLAHRRDVLNLTNSSCLLMGSLFGVAPMIIYNLQHPMVTFLRLGSRALNVSKAEALDSGTNFMTVFSWIARYLSDVPGRALTQVQNLGPLLGLDLPGGFVPASLVVVSAMLALWQWDKRSAKSIAGPRMGRWCVWIIFGAMLFAWMFGLDRPRHLVTIYSVLPLGLAALYERIRDIRSWAGHLLVGTLLLIAGIDLVKDATRPCVSVAPIIEAAERHGISGLYADYDTAYLVMFFTQEKILASPAAWSGDGVVSDRMPLVTREVDGLQNPMYVFSPNSVDAPRFAQTLARRGISFTRRTVGSYDVFFGLSVPARSGDFPLRDL